VIVLSLTLIFHYQPSTGLVAGVGE
jgi:hypothetical protein